MNSSVLIFVFDGLQLSQVTPELMPSLAALAAEGVTFRNHHPVFPTVTRVNVASITTGRYPGGHGLAGNSLVVSEYDPDRAIPALRPELSEVYRSTGRLLLAPNLADVLRANGREYVAIGTGSNGNSYLQNPNADTSGGATINPEFCLPDELHKELVARFGPWPEKGLPAEEQLAHAVRIMTEYVLPERAPAVALFWSSEPDSAQHAAGVGSELGVRALEVADRQFGRLLEWLESSGRAADTDVIVASDHGYTTAKAVVVVEDLVAAAGFPPGGHPGGVVVASNGGSELFYVRDHDQATADKLAAWLMAQPWCGALVASAALGEIEGALPAALVGIEGPRAPDLAMSFAWDAEPNAAGFPGHMYNASKAPGLGNHGSMSRFEQRCAHIARGPSFKRGLELATPTGNVDIMPTVLRVLGVKAPDNMDGRVIEEALVGGPDAESVDWSTDVHKAERRVNGGVYRQEITVSRAGKTEYVDEGSATLEPR